ncbi:hypothetical protein AVEN_206267-1 [Araneus ventricosus]|uniref:Uncharacterized protein n=1 Tax=Araneus ventricosus TaxID=182803 RepID=A0A4Y2M507_ARAVE|nr:hypothetical protein AVEN_169574-1 [Araneus ventricosus]GBN22158.1 hypothetical protein AVEN_206267-1 [Araneus ventricosus]
MDFTEPTEEATTPPPKLDIHEGSVPVHLEYITPHRSHFQLIHLGNSFTKTPCKTHTLSLQSPRATVPTLPPAFETGLPPLLPEIASLPKLWFALL